MSADQGYGEPGRSGARLLISCPDRPGIVAAVSGFLFARGANIVTSDQYSTDPHGGSFYMRMTFHLEDLDAQRAELERAFGGEVAAAFGMNWRISYGADRRRVALMASRQDHCLLDLLWRWRRGELDMDVIAVISNHSDHRADVEGFGIPYHHIPVETGRKAEAEERALGVLAGKGAAAA